MAIDYSELASGKACEQCGAQIPNGGIARWGIRRFCSVPCRNRALSERQRKYAIRECPICGKRMEGPRLTCSASCGYKFRKLRSRKQKTCPICSVKFWPLKRRGGVWQTYCSRACQNVKLSERLAMIQVTCLQCSRIFRRTKGAVKRQKRHFCNKVCFHKFNVGENTANWRGGHDPNRGPEWLKIAASIRDRDEHVCRRCGKTEAENGKKLDVDHIVPWRLFPGRPDIANSPSNLVSLCARCHRYKTAKLEQAYLEGDCTGMSAYENSISLPPLFEHYKGLGR